MAQFAFPYNPMIGPIVTLEVRYPATTASYTNVQNPFVPVKFLIDTGSGRMYLSATVANSIGLPPGPPAKITTSQNRNVLTPTFIGDLRFPAINKPFPSLTFVEFGNPTERYDGLLGRHILDQGILHIDGRKLEITIDL